MNYEQFMEWFERLDLRDREFLRKKKDWEREREKVALTHILPKGFMERTMEILEGGSESET